MVKQAPDSEFLGAEPGISPRQGDAIRRGLNFLFAKWNGTGWGQPASNTWLTAYVLSRLGELAPGVLDHALGQKIQVSCDWLSSSRTSEGGWNDLPTTAYAVSALKSLGRDPGRAALEALERSLLICGNMASESTPFAAALAVKATGKALPVTCEALEAALEQTSMHGSGLSQLLLCAEILDWPPELVPQPLSLVVSDVVEQLGENPPDRISLLRCLLRLRRPRAWEMAAELRAEQLSDGPWHAPEIADQMVGSLGLPKGQLNYEDERVLTTASAIAALAIGQTQPGLYFGSDEPAPRRLRVVKAVR